MVDETGRARSSDRPSERPEGRAASEGGEAAGPGAERDEWVSTKEAAERLGLTQRTIYRFIDEGKLPGYRFGRVIRVKASDIDGLIEESRIEPGSLSHLYPEPHKAES